MIDWTRFLRSRKTLALAGLALAAALAGGLVSAERAARQGADRDTAPHAKRPPKPRPAPAALQSRLDALVAAYGEEIGIAVSDVGESWTVRVDADRLYPQQSVSKLWVAIAVMKAVDEGRIDLDVPLLLTDADRSVFFQPVAQEIGRAGYATTVSDLLRRALVESDNAANDRLMLEVGGPGGVAAALASVGLRDVKVGAYERDLQSRAAGLTWRPQYGYGRNFQAAREALPLARRRAAIEAYAADPPDGASPAAIAAALGALSRGELLSKASTARILDLMAQARTGPKRLKGGLPPGWAIAHKTGTGQDFQGASYGINDVGLITAPDGRTYAVAVMMRRAARPVPERLAFMQAVSAAIAEQWARDAGS